MFDGIKKKFSNFIKSVTKKEEEAIEEESVAKTQVIQEPTIEGFREQKPQNIEVKKPENSIHEDKEEKIAPQDIAKHSQPHKEKVNNDKVENKVEKTSEHAKIDDSNNFSNGKINNNYQLTDQKNYKKEDNNKIKPETVEEQKDKEIQTIEKNVIISKNTSNNESFRKDNKEQPEQQPKVSFGTKFKGVFLKEVSVKEADITPFLEDLKLSLLQSDVNYDATEKILENIKVGLVGKKITSKQIDSQITSVLRESILKILKKTSTIDLVSMAKEKKATGEPFKILFIGPNGAGKTTTMAKLANLFIKSNLTVTLSASDTFRAAAVEQTVIHAERLGIGVIKGKYGADPASVAFDAIAHAKAHHINVVLIDSAGRQETNKSLMEEVKKIVRITKPDLKIFVGESITGNSLLGQVMEFNTAIGLDGIILTKLDCDAKGGNTLSILSETNVPVLFFGTGEGYDDILPYNPEYIIENMVAS